MSIQQWLWSCDLRMTNSFVNLRFWSTSYDSQASVPQPLTRSQFTSRSAAMLKSRWVKLPGNVTNCATILKRLFTNFESNCFIFNSTKFLLNRCSQHLSKMSQIKMSVDCYVSFLNLFFEVERKNFPSILSCYGRHNASLPPLLLPLWWKERIMRLFLSTFSKNRHKFSAFVGFAFK